MTRVILNNATKIYKNDQKAVDSVSFEAEDGEFLVLVGPSGCGKTTILRMIAGLEDLTSGEIYFDDRLINDVEPSKRDVGMVFQNYALYPHLSVFENIAFPLKSRNDYYDGPGGLFGKSRKLKKEELRRRVIEAAEMLGLQDYLERKPKELSGGQRQRAALGRAIVRKPNVFLFDEPLSNLDAKLRAVMRSEITRIQKTLGATSVYVTHDQVEAMTMGTKLIVLKDGAVMQIDSPDELYDNPKNKFTAEFIGSPQMNFFRGEIVLSEGAKFAGPEGNLFDVSGRLGGGDVRNGTPAFLGVRPEDLIPVGEENLAENSFEATVENVEHLGREKFVYTRSGGETICARADSSESFRFGERRKFALGRKLYLFGEDGERI